MKSWTIYKLTNAVNGKCYIGQTCNFARRMSNYERGNEGRAIGRAIARHGWENFTMEIVKDSICAGDVDIYEDFYMIYYRSLSPNGYNLKYNCFPNTQFKRPSHISDLPEYVCDVVLWCLKKYRFIDHNRLYTMIANEMMRSFYSSREIRETLKILDL